MDNSKADEAITRLEQATNKLDKRVQWLERAVSELRIAAEGNEIEADKYERIQKVWNGPTLETKASGRNTK